MYPLTKRMQVLRGRLSTGCYPLRRRFDGRPLTMGRPHLALETLEVVADGHGKGQQFFERFLGLVKGDGDAARLEAHPRGEVLELLCHNLNRGLV